MRKNRPQAVPRTATARSPAAPAGEAGRRRKRRRLLWIGLAVAVIVTATGLALYPYPPIPTVEVDAARQALLEARREARELAPEPLRQAETASATMESLLAVDRSRWVRFTRLEPLDQAIDDVRTFSAQAIADARHARKGHLDTGAEEYRRLAADLERLQPQVRFLPPRERSARSAFARAELALAEAAGALRDGDLALLAASLGNAQSQIARTREALDSRYARFSDPGWRSRWQSWADGAVAASRGGKVALVIHKLDRRVYVYRDGRLAEKFDADLGRNALVDKVTAGDGATPEGRYHVTEKRSNGTTRWYKALMLNYPNEEDLKNFHALRRRGEVPRGRGPGGLIEIHGHGGKESNWTDGCVAVRNAAMDRLFAAVPVGTPVAIVGTADLPGAGA